MKLQGRNGSIKISSKLKFSPAAYKRADGIQRSWAACSWSLCTALVLQGYLSEWKTSSVKLLIIIRHNNKVEHQAQGAVSNHRVSWGHKSK